MKIRSFLTIAAASTLSTAVARHGDVHLKALEHRHLHHKGRAMSSPERGYMVDPEAPAIEKRTGQCQFPEDAGLVSVGGGSNGGWAMSPDECCEPGGYCPYACPPGQLSMQWDPEATSYAYPQSMHGGLFCDKNGNIKKPFPNRPYCIDGTGNVGCHNKATGNVAICQTVLPGNEAMLIPTIVENSATLAIPGPEYWAGTAAHFYVNPPGVSPEEGCVWGTAEKPRGNWSPYVLGGNAVDGGETFIKLGWNPIYLEPATPFRDEKPTFAIEIVCEGDGCNGLPCAIDPSQHGVNELVGGGGSSGAGGAVSCVVTVPAGGSAKYVITELGGNGNGNGDGGSSGSNSHNGEQHPSPPPPSSHSAPPPPPPSTPSPTSTFSEPEDTPTPTPTPTPTTSSEVPSSTPSETFTPLETPTPTPTPTQTLTPTPTLSPSTSSTSLSSSSLSSSSSTSASTTTSSSPSPSYTSKVYAVHLKASSSASLKPSYTPHVFADNSTATTTYASGSATGSVSVTSSASESSGTSATMSPIPFQPGTPNGAGYTHITAAAFSLTVLAAVAVIAL
ncbi:MAG: hypothetical protein Q9219_003837 [cf. Caloplaca sp. 3 TL-2023]